jgi:very long chain acyl-CoA dehydrogenase
MFLRSRSFSSPLHFFSFFQSIQAFGFSCEELLIKYGKKIIDEQFLLWRVADAAIDIYGMVGAISRASRSLDANSPSAVMEEHLTKLFCNEVRYP